MVMYGHVICYVGRTCTTLYNPIFRQPCLMVLLLHVQLWVQVDEVEQPHISERAVLQLTPSVDLGT